MFAAGYVVVWVLAGLAGYGLVEAVRSLHSGALAWSESGRYVAELIALGALVEMQEMPRSRATRVGRPLIGQVKLLPTVTKRQPWAV